MSLHFLVGIVLSIVINPVALLAQSFPVKPIRIVTSDPGGGSDIVARAMAPGMANTLGQPVIIDNRAGGFIAGEFVSKAPPDGYTLIFYGNSLWVAQLMRGGVPYDALKDFVPVVQAVTAANILVVHPSLPVRSVKALIDLAKARPGELNYASAAIGTSNHLAAELFKSMAKVNIVRIGYRGQGAATIDLLGGQVPIMFATSTGAGTHIQAGRLRALAISSAEPSAAFPELPTIASQGLPGYESTLNSGLLAPARTPEAVIRRLNQEAVRALKTPDIIEKFNNIGVEVVASSPEHFGSKIKSEMTLIGKVVREAGIRME